MMNVNKLHEISAELFKYGSFLFALLILLISCRSESVVQEGSENEPDLKLNATIVTLIRQITLNDGSNDNIIDRSNCFTIVFPYMVTVNGINLTIESTDDYNRVEDVLEESELTQDEITIKFPVTLLNPNYSTISVVNQAMFDALVNNCDNQTDDEDIECLDFNYPIAISTYNTANDNFRTIIINNDIEMFSFIENFDENDIANIQFPIEIKLSDGSTVITEDIDALETLIENTKDNCDEDDDNDFNDDDCLEGCELLKLEMVLMSCKNWEVEDFKYDGSHTNDFKDDYLFNFLGNNMLTIVDDDDDVIANGNWYVTVVGGVAKIEFDIPVFPRFNMVWDLDDIHYGKSHTKIKLEIDKDNHLRFENKGSDDDDN